MIVSHTLALLLDLLIVETEIYKVIFSVLYIFVHHEIIDAD